MELGAEVSERAGRRVVVMPCDEPRVFHASHPSPDADKDCGFISSISYPADAPAGSFLSRLIVVLIVFLHGGRRNICGPLASLRESV